MRGPAVAADKRTEPAELAGFEHRGSDLVALLGQVVETHAPGLEQVHPVVLARSEGRALGAAPHPELV
jgi:hypothetical protein